MPKVLLIDDDAKLRMTVSEWLEHEKFEMHEAKNGVEAKEKLSNFVYDLVVLDWNLLDADGVDICRWFRGQGGSTPILMLTGKSLINDKEDSFDAGVDDYLTKPFDLRELSARINAILRRGSSVAPSRTVSFGLLVVDPLEHTAKIDGEELQLSPREFGVLELLLRHPGQVFSNSVLLDRLWQNDVQVSPDTVRVFIKRLREKLEKYGHREMLKNIRGVGYKLSKV